MLAARVIKSNVMETNLLPIGIMWLWNMKSTLFYFLALQMKSSWIGHTPENGRAQRLYSSLHVNCMEAKKRHFTGPSVQGSLTKPVDPRPSDLCIPMEGLVRDNHVG